MSRHGHRLEERDAAAGKAPYSEFKKRP